MQLTERDIDYISRVVETEVPAWIERKNPQQYQRMVQAVTDTITNRIAHPRFPNSLTGVLNQRRQFSKITGPKNLNPYGSVEKTPRAKKTVEDAVRSHVSARAKGAPSVVGGNVHYANPKFSSPSNVTGWINPMIDAGAKKFGVGDSVHWHGNAPGFDDAPDYRVSFNGDTAQSTFAETPESAPTPFAPESLLAAAPEMGGGLLSGLLSTPKAAAATMPNGGISAAQREAITQPRLVHQLAGKHRSEIPTSGIDQKVAESLNRVVPNGETVLVSGMEPQGRSPFGSPNRHPKGFAGDFDFRTADGTRTSDPRVMHDVAMDMAARHNANIGYDQNSYMGAGRMHIDTMPLDKYGGGAQWGNTAKGWAENLNFARKTGMGPTPLSGPIPESAPQQREQTNLGGSNHPMGEAASSAIPQNSLLSMQPREPVSTRESPHERAPLSLAPTPTARPEQSATQSMGAPAYTPPSASLLGAPESSPEALQSLAQLQPTQNPHAGGLLDLAPTPTSRPQSALEARSPHFGQSAVKAPDMVTAAPLAAPMRLTGDMLVGSPDLARNQINANTQPAQLLGGVDDISQPLGEAVKQSPSQVATQGTGVALEPDPETEKEGFMSKIMQPKNIGKVGGVIAGNMVAGPVGGLIGGMLGGKLGGSLSGQGVLGGLGGGNFGLTPNAYQGDLNFVGYGGGQGPMAARYGAAGTAYNDSAGGRTVANGRGGFTRTNRFGVTEYTSPDGHTSVVSGGTGLLSGFARDMGEAFGGKKT